jgi:hypothetical protein
MERIPALTVPSAATAYAISRPCCRAGTMLAFAVPDGAGRRMGVLTLAVVETSKPGLSSPAASDFSSTD